ncbi:MAG: T9SS type A sorting domain-containing protein [Bacteroidota bacterium]
MKRNYFTLILVCLFFSAKFLAQLNGVYTINNTIAASATNFTSFATFAASLNVGGVSGPVTVNVLSNAVFTEQVNFNQAPGISSTNTVTINGNGATLTFNATSATLRHTLLLTGADYMTINSLTVTGTNATNALSCHLWAGANNNKFNFCVFNAALVGTGTTLVPFSISGTSVSATGTGLSGSTNVVNTCTTNGGYYGVAFYSSTSAPFDTDNSLLNSRIMDFYSTGVYNVYCKSTIIKGNIVERPTRNNITSSEGIYLGTSSASSLVDGNHVRRMFDGILGSTSTCYGIYLTADGALGTENVVKNNIVSDFRSSGTQGGIYATAAAYALMYHNTINLDDNTSTAGLTYGIYCTGANNAIRNNIITISRTGSGAKHCLYLTTASAPTLVSDHNVLVMTSSGGNVGFLTSGYTTLAAWKAANPGLDQFSSDADPMYTNVSLMNFVPTSTVINNMCPYIGVAFDFINFTRSTVSPDPGAYEFYTLPCIGTAPQNAIVTPTAVLCPNTPVNLQLANTFTNTGYSVQWQSAPGILGPYTAITGATLPSYNTSNLTTSTYYNALITCANGGGTVTATPGQVQIALPTTNTVPYYEGFEGITVNNGLPNCSWLVSNPNGSTLTYTSLNTNNRVPRTGTKFASFFNSPSGTSYFYTNGIYMVPGITYSAALWYINESVGYNSWADLSILVGLNQAPGGLVSVASTTAAAVLYTALSNTFTVNTAGFYYVAIRATSSSLSSPYLSWDDLSVTIPCSLNAPPLALTTIPTSICSGQSVSFIASGANTYSWSSGQNTPTINPSPGFNTTYAVVGTSTLSGCSTTLSQLISVNPSPQIAVLASSLSICEGQSTNIFAFGASTYNWSHGPFTSSVTVAPTTSTTYSVIGVNSFSCSSMQSIFINVNPVPVVSAISSSYLLCKGEPVTFTGIGAVNFQWSSIPSVIYTGNPLTINAQNSGSYTAIGTDVNGCKGSTSFILSVDECTGINEFASDANQIQAYPNPNNGVFTVMANGSSISAFEVTDVAGRIVLSGTPYAIQTKINIAELPNGVYSVKVKTADALRYVKIIKANN